MTNKKNIIGGFGQIHWNLICSVKSKNNREQNCKFSNDFRNDSAIIRIRFNGESPGTTWVCKISRDYLEQKKPKKTKKHLKAILDSSTIWTKSLIFGSTFWFTAFKHCISSRMGCVELKNTPTHCGVTWKQRKSKNVQQVFKLFRQDAWYDAICPILHRFFWSSQQLSAF